MPVRMAYVLGRYDGRVLVQFGPNSRDLDPPHYIMPESLISIRCPEGLYGPAEISWDSADPVFVRPPKRPLEERKKEVFRPSREALEERKKTLEAKQPPKAPDQGDLFSPRKELSDADRQRGLEPKKRARRPAKTKRPAPATETALEQK